MQSKVRHTALPQTARCSGSHLGCRCRSILPRTIISYGHDGLNRMTRMVDAIGSTTLLRIVLPLLSSFVQVGRVLAS